MMEVTFVAFRQFSRIWFRLYGVSKGSGGMSCHNLLSLGRYLSRATPFLVPKFSFLG